MSAPARSSSLRPTAARTTSAVVLILAGCTLAGLASFVLSWGSIELPTGGTFTAHGPDFARAVHRLPDTSTSSVADGWFGGALFLLLAAAMPALTVLLPFRRGATRIVAAALELLAAALVFFIAISGLVESQGAEGDRALIVGFLVYDGILVLLAVLFVCGGIGRIAAVLGVLLVAATVVHVVGLVTLDPGQGLLPSAAWLVAGGYLLTAVGCLLTAEGLPRRSRGSRRGRHA